jgi:hypothetical protein
MNVAIEITISNIEIFGIIALYYFLIVVKLF